MGKEFLIMREDDVLGVIEDGNVVASLNVQGRHYAVFPGACPFRPPRPRTPEASPWLNREYCVYTILKVASGAT
jgi:hypothetical protein